MFHSFKGKHLPSEPRSLSDTARIRGVGPSLISAVVVVVLGALAPASVQGQQSPVEITIKRRSGNPVALTLLHGPLGPEATRVLDGDLRRSPLLRFTESASQAWMVSGQADAGRLVGRLTDPEGREVFTRTYTAVPPEKNAHRFADDILAAIIGSPGIAASEIVFVSNQSGSKELYVCDYDGGNIRRITNDQSISVSPSISRDGTWIVYTAYRSGYPDIFSIDLRTGARTRIVDAPGTNSGAAIAPGSDRFALTMSFSGNPEIYVVNKRGSNPRRLTRSPGVEASPAWFPDGRRLVYAFGESNRPQLYEISASGGTPRILKTGFTYCTEPEVSPDGNRLAFSTLEAGSMAVAVYEFTSGAARIVSAGGSAESPCWGADSRHLVYVKSGDLYLHDVDSGKVTRIIEGMGTISEPTWSHRLTLSPQQL